MRRVGKNAYTEIYFAGCNPSFVETSDGYVMIDSPQQPIDAVRWRERMEEKAPIRYLINTEPHGDHISGNAYFTNTQIIGQVQLQECFERYLNAFGSLDEKRERFKQSDPDSVWLVGHPDYPAANPPTLTFDRTLTLNLGNHTFNIIHMPGHTAPQTSVHVPEEGVVFTGDNVFYKCRSWLQECDPWQWLAALDSIAALDVEMDRAGPRRPVHQGLSQGAGADRRQLDRLCRAPGRPRRRRRRGAQRPDRGRTAGPLSDRPAPLHAQ